MIQKSQDYDLPANFLHAAIQSFGGFEDPKAIALLDFGCGGGSLCQRFLALGYDAYGCDVKAYWAEGSSQHQDRLGLIEPSPYRLPYADGSFDVVVSTSVLEHAQNKVEIFREIHRVLRPGGCSMHLYPGKWYLPVEPHIYVPLVSWFWPRCPKWWLVLWARLGVRNEFQLDMGWKDVVASNVEYCKSGLSYWTEGAYRRLSKEVFGNYSAPMAFFIERGYGGVARLLRRLPLHGVTGRLAGHLRMNFIVQRRES